MKFVIVLSALICCANAQSSTSIAPPLKDQLLRRAEILDNRVKAEIKRLTDEKLEHLAQLLTEEEKRLETLTAQLKTVTASDVVRMAVLEEELITLEYRVEAEINNLQRERATAELLLSNAALLKQWTTDEIKLLESSTENRNQAQEIARELRSAELRLDEIVKELEGATGQRQIERTEVELRAIEVRLNEALRRLNYNPATGTPAPGTTPVSAATTKTIITVAPTTPSPTPKPSTISPTTIQATTSTKTTTHATTLTSTHITSKPTTLSAIQLRDLLTKRAIQLEHNLAIEIAKLKKENRISQAVPLEQLEAEVKNLVSKLPKYQQADILALLESELYWLERRLDIELEALVAQDQRVQRLLDISAALKQRIVSVEKVLGETPVGAAVREESKKLDDLTAKLKVANDIKSIDALELDLALIEKRVNTELGAFVNPTTKAF